VATFEKEYSSNIFPKYKKVITAKMKFFADKNICDNNFRGGK
jgi:hypothetical protein